MKIPIKYATITVTRNIKHTTRYCFCDFRINIIPYGTGKNQYIFPKEEKFMSNIISPEELWSSVSLPEELDAEMTSTREINGNVYSDVYFNGRRFGDAVTRIYGVLAYPKGRENLPVILLVHDTDSSVDTSFIDFFLSMNFAVLMCDMGGKAEGRKYTYYPDAISYANRCENADSEIRIVKDTPEKTMAFEWTCVQMCAIKLIKSLKEFDGNKIAAVGIRDGSEIVWRLSYLEPSLSCAATLFYAGWGELGRSYKNDENKQGEITSELASYVAALSPQSYAPIIKTPMMYLTASNSELANLDRALDTMARVNGEVQSITYITPNALDSIDNLGTVDLKLWLCEHLLDADIVFPDKPMLSLENFSNKLVATCVAGDPLTVKSVELYYAEGSFIPSRRCYLKRELTLSGGGNYVGSVDISSSDEFIYAFVNVEFTTGYTVTSNIVNVHLSEMGFEKTLMREKLIYNGLMEEDVFTAIPSPDQKGASGTFVDKKQLFIKEGAGGIEGITSGLSLASFKLATQKYRGVEDELLMFDVCTDEVMSITVTAYCNLGTPEKDVHRAVIATVGGPLWQNFKLERSDFKDDTNKTLSDWGDITLLVFEGDGQFIVNNILWI